MPGKANEYKIPADVVSQIRDIVAAAESAIQELITKSTRNRDRIGPKEEAFYQKYCQTMFGDQDELGDIF